MRTKTFSMVSAAALLCMGALTACGGGSDANGSGSGGESGGTAQMTFWHNATTGPGKAFWEKTVSDFQATHPNVKIKIQALQNEELDGKLQTALNSGSAPDIFLQRGGGKMAAMVNAGQLMDLSDVITPATKTAIPEASFKANQLNGKTYAMPVAVLPGGLWYSKDLFKKAGITQTPTTLDELNSDIQKLKDAGIDPIALGAKDAWPAAHWYYFFAVRACSQDVIESLSTSPDFTDQCWLDAAENLNNFAETEPFNNGFLTTSAQQGANSSAGLVANHQAAMELMGAWNVGVIASLTPDEKPLADLGWFPFPEVSDGAGTPGAMMGGVDGYACSVDSPAACEEFLNFISSKEWQEKYAVAYQTIPANQDATGAVTDPSLKPLMEAYSKAPYVSLWLDTALGQNVGNALNTGVVEMLAGQGDPQKLVDSIANAAARG